MADLVRDDSDITVRDLRGVPASAPRPRRRPAWDWETDELAGERLAQLEELRCRVMELEVQLERATDGEARVRRELQRLAAAGRRERRRLVAELRRSELVEEG